MKDSMSKSKIHVSEVRKKIESVWSWNLTFRVKA